MSQTFAPFKCLVGSQFLAFVKPNYGKVSGYHTIQTWLFLSVRLSEPKGHSKHSVLLLGFSGLWIGTYRIHNFMIFIESVNSVGLCEKARSLQKSAGTAKRHYISK